MPSHPRYKVQSQIGKWTLINKLGEGGNAEVWQARDESERTVALKILHNSAREARFRGEIRFYTEHKDNPGILRYVEDGTSQGTIFRKGKEKVESLKWLALEMAKPIEDILKGPQDLILVVEALAVIADTLADFATEGIWHRDIKPNNLFRYENRWVIGDWGLIKTPFEDWPATTETGEHVGSLHYVAPEVTRPGRPDDLRPADVYSLAKTLYVLGTGRPTPLDGWQRFDEHDPSRGMRQYVDHYRALDLDKLISRATEDEPTDRPTMAEFARELHEWLVEPKELSSPLDVRDIFDQASFMSTSIAATRQKESAERSAHAEANRRNRVEQVLDNGMQQLVQDSSKLPIGPFKRMDQGYCQIFRFAGIRPYPRALYWEVCSVYCLQYREISLFSGLVFEALDNTTGIVDAAHMILDQRSGQASPESLLGHVPYRENSNFCWHQQMPLQINSLHPELVINELVQGLIDSYRDAVVRFVSHLNEIYS